MTPHANATANASLSGGFLQVAELMITVYSSWSVLCISLSTEMEMHLVMSIFCCFGVPKVCTGGTPCHVTGGTIYFGKFVGL